MSYKILIISVLASIFVLFKSENTHAAHENEKQLADVLSEILSNPGWRKITDVQVKHSENLLFGGKHFPNDTRVNEENSEKMAKKIGDLDRMENVGSKYLTTVHLLGCVYANVLFEFCHSFANILLVNKKERQRSRSKAHWMIYKGPIGSISNAKDSDDNEIGRQNGEGESVEGLSAKKQSTADKGPEKKRTKIKNPAKHELYKTIINYDVSAEIISVVIRILQNTYHMFDYMEAALRYLLEAIPFRVGIDFKFNFSDITEIRATANDFLTLSKGLLKTVPKYIDVIVWNTNTRACCLLKRAIDRRMKYHVVPYLEKHCTIVPETIVNPDITTLINTIDDSHQSEPQSNIVKDSEKQIETLVQMFKSNHFSKLGFVYGETEHNIGYVYHTSI